MTGYLVLYWTHISAVVISGSFFALRGIWMLQESALLQTRFTRVAPHVVDTVLLGAAIGLSIVTRQYPIASDWLTVKLIALLVYIGLGMVALRRGRSLQIRLACLVLALACFLFMVSVALTRDPLGLFGVIL